MRAALIGAIFFLGFFAGYAAIGPPALERLAPLWIAALVCASGLAWRVWGSSYLGAGIVFNAAIVTDELTVSGPYRYTRNPLYLGLSLYALGIAMLGPPLTIAIVFVCINVLQYALIFSEERRLRARFGERYERYLGAVPRMLPSLRPRLPDSGIRPSLAIGMRAEAFVLLLAVASFGFALSRGR